jgi:Flp pilus assembly protein TadG
MAMLSYLRRRVCSSLSSFAADRGGAIAILMALASTALIGFVGLGVDVASWQIAERDMQGAADEAAFSAAIAADAGGAWQVNAKGITAQMGFVDTKNGVTVQANNPPTRGGYAGDSIGYEVIISQPQPSWFSRLFLTSVTASARAVALAKISGDYCLLALDPNASGAFNVQGGQSNIVNTANCNIQVNSANGAGANWGGSASVMTKTLSYHGGYSGSTSQIQGTLVKAGTINDPDAGMTVPSYTPCSSYQTTNINGQTAPTAPSGNPPISVFCGGLKFNGQANVTLSPGIYIIDGGTLSFTAGSVVNGTGVTFVLTNGANVVVNGGSTVNLTAPRIDAASPLPTAGFVFYQAPSDTAAADFNGGSAMSFAGTLYFPSAAVTYNGGSATPTSQCTLLISDTMKFSGSAGFGNNCDGLAHTVTGSPTSMVE